MTSHFSIPKTICINKFVLRKTFFSWLFGTFLSVFLLALVSCRRCCKPLPVASVWQGGKSVSQDFSPVESVEVKQRGTVRGHEAQGEFRGSQTDRFLLYRSGSPGWRPCSQRHTSAPDATDWSDCQQGFSTLHRSHLTHLDFMLSIGLKTKQTKRKELRSQKTDAKQWHHLTGVQQMLGSRI